MPFQVYIPDHERAYLDGLALSPEAKDRINQFIEQQIADVADEFRGDPENRPDPNKPCFRCQYLFWDVWGNRCVHRIDFYVLDDTAPFGVLVIAYVELHQGRPLEPPAAPA